MASGLLSLKWNNHRSTFFHVLSNIRSKESYCDVTLACDGRFYSLHKFVLSTCSEYFEEMFERTQCKHPVIVLKDINSEDLEALLNYMYVGEVNVVQEKLAGLIKAAECLKIKGLAVPDEDPMESKDNSSIDRERHKRSQRGEDSPRAKRRRRENSSDVSEEILSPVRSRPSARNREYHSSQNSKSAPVAPSEENEEGSREMHGLTDASEEAENSSINANRRIEGHNKTKLSSQLKSKREPEQVNLEEEEEEQEVKAEPREEEEDEGAVGGEDGGEGMEELESKASLHEQLGLDVQDATDDGYSNAAMMEGQLDGSAGASGYHENSFLWEGEGSLSAFPGDGFSGDSSSQSRQMVRDGSPTALGVLSLPPDQQLERAPLSQVLSSRSGGGRSLHKGLVVSASSLVNQLSKSSAGNISSAAGLGHSMDGLVSSLSGIASSFSPLSSQYCGAKTSSNNTGSVDSRGGSGRPVSDEALMGSLPVATVPYTGELIHCQSCTKVFRFRSEFVRHERTHTGEKPFACTVCGCSYTQLCSLKRHFLTAHPHAPHPPNFSSK